MARPERNTVDYYPHIVEDGKKMYSLDKKYKNDGYAAFFKILDKLASTEYHYLDLNNEDELIYLSSRCNVSEELLLEIISYLAKLGKFDKELWEYKIIWCQYFIDNIQEAYKKRNNNCITIDGLRVLLTSLGVLNGVKVPVKPHTIEEYIREEKSIEDITKVMLPDAVSPPPSKPPINKWISTFDDRKEKFKTSLFPFTNYGKNKGPYTKDMVHDFFEYWNEPNKSRSRMRWESEKTWELSKRLATWAKKEPFINKPFNGNSIIAPTNQRINHDDRP